MFVVLYFDGFCRPHVSYTFSTTENIIERKKKTCLCFRNKMLISSTFVDSYFLYTIYFHNFSLCKGYSIIDYYNKLEKLNV